MRRLACVVAAWLALGAHALASSTAATASSFSTTTEGHDHLQPGGLVDYVISGVGVVILLVVIYFAVLWFVRPREPEADHIKRKILEGSKW